MLAKLQRWLFSQGADKDFGVWDMLGNLVQDLRNKLNSHPK